MLNKTTFIRDMKRVIHYQKKINTLMCSIDLATRFKIGMYLLRWEKRFTNHIIDGLNL